MNCPKCNQPRIGRWTLIPARHVGHKDGKVRRWGRPTTIRTLVYRCGCP